MSEFDMSAMLAAADESNDPMHAMMSEAIEAAEGDDEKAIEILEEARTEWLKRQ